MPTYLPPVAGVTFAEAYAEACTYADVRVAMLDTLSFAHPLIGTGTELRFVGDGVPLTAVLEAGAPIQPSQSVQFGPCAFSIGDPAQDPEQPTPEMRITLAGITQTAARAIHACALSTSPLWVTHRVYDSTDTSAPAVLPPTRLQVVSAEVTATAVQITARLQDPGNRAFPGATYTRAQYPGLAP